MLSHLDRTPQIDILGRRKDTPREDSITNATALVIAEERPRLRKVPVLVVTGTRTSQYDLRGFPPVTLLHKPLNIEVLAPAIQLLLGQAHN